MSSQINTKLQKFFSTYKHQSFSKGEILIRADDTPQGIYFLTAGEVKKYAISARGEESIITIFKPNTFFPMSFAINQTANKYYYEAINDVEVWRAPVDKTVTFINENPDVVLDLLRRVYSGLDGLTERMVNLMGGNAYDRIVVELLISTKRFGKKIVKDNGTCWILKLSEKDLAAQSGLTRETISRELKVLKEKKVLSYERSVLIINDLKLLENQLSSTY
jgi:CRP-like cAMP-binding protein